MLLRTDPKFITDADRATLTVEQIDAKAATQPIARVHGRDILKAELSAAFDLVADKAHWKNPIDATLQLTTEQVALIHDAALFFGAGEAKFHAPAQTVQWDNGDNMVAVYHVTAPGYYATIGA